MVENPDDSRDCGNDAEDSWQVVFERCQGGLRAFLRNRLGQEADVDDCLQAVFVKMTHQQQRSDSEVAPVARRAWLFRVASNEAALHWRNKAATGRMIEKQGSRLHPSDTLSPDTTDKIILTETSVKVRQAVEQLPEPYRDIVQMRIDQEKTFQQIADELGIPLGTALTRMRRALSRLRETLEND